MLSVSPGSSETDKGNALGLDLEACRYSTALTTRTLKELEVSRGGVNGGSNVTVPASKYLEVP